MDSFPFYVALLGAPIAVAALLYFLVHRSKLAWMAKRIVIGPGLARLGEVSFEPKDLMRALAIAFPFFIYSNIYNLPGSGLFPLVLVSTFCWFVGPKLRRAKPDDSALIEELKTISVKALQAGRLAEQLGALLDDRKSQIADMDRLHEDLQAKVQARQKDAELWAAMSEEARADIAESIAKHNRKGSSWRWILGAAVSVLLNLVATFIWMMAGNPGQNEIVATVTRARDILAAPLHPVAKR